MYENLICKKTKSEKKLCFKIYPSIFGFAKDINNDSIVMDTNQDHNISDEISMISMSSNWDNTLATGITNIDSQHKKIFIYINELLHHMKQGKEKNEIIKLLSFLEKCVIQNFNEEEAIQKQNNYPKFNLQHKEHEKFKDELKKLRNELGTKDVSELFIINMQQKMFKWYRRHVINLDKDFGTFMLEKFR